MDVSNSYLITYVILVTAFLLMLHFAVRDHKSLLKGQHEDSKSVIVSIGVLGTFVGISIGLYSFDTQNIDSSVPLLLEGLKLAFLTSIAGMIISIFLSFIQRGKIQGGDDELSILSEISEKLSSLSHLETVSSGFERLRTDFRDEQKETRVNMKSGFEDVSSELKLIVEGISDVAKDDTIIAFRNEIHEHQVKLKEFLEDQFVQTNNSLDNAIEVLSKGATEEIIKALETVIKDFNKNLTEQFGDNFKELNAGIINLLDWQDKYKETVEKDYGLLVQIRESLNTTKETLIEIADRNSQLDKFYSELTSIINAFDTQLGSINGQLKTYSEMGDKASTAFDALSDGFSKVQDGMGAQSEAIAKLTNDLQKQVPESLGNLENSLVSLTKQFGKDYQAFLDNYRKLIS